MDRTKTLVWEYVPNSMNCEDDIYECLSCGELIVVNIYDEDLPSCPVCRNLIFKKINYNQ